MGARLALWAAARLLARRYRVHARGRCRRTLRAVAALRDRHLLGGIYAWPAYRRRRACRDGDLADGRHQRLHGPDDRFRAERAGDDVQIATVAFWISRPNRQLTRLF